MRDCAERLFFEFDTKSSTTKTTKSSTKKNDILSICFVVSIDTIEPLYVYSPELQCLTNLRTAVPNLDVEKTTASMTQLLKVKKMLLSTAQTA